MLRRRKPAAPVRRLIQIERMKISIVTPSLRNSDWLKLCVASVADQRGVELEHIVQDSCSDDGTLDWLPPYETLDRILDAYVVQNLGREEIARRGFDVAVPGCLVKPI